MKTWDILKATYLIALLHISNDNTAYLFEISRYIKYFETRTIRLLDSLVIGNILAKFENNLSSRFFFRGMTLTVSKIWEARGGGGFN